MNKKIIDFHTHCFPDRIAERAIKSLAKNSGNAVPAFDGTYGGLSDLIAKSKADMAVVLGIATNPKQQKNVNDFLIEINKNDNVVCFGSIHPDAHDAVEELHRIKENGLKGVKLHPDYQEFFVDDDRMFEIYDTINKLGLLLTFHAGVDIGLPNPIHCPPERLVKILSGFTNTNVIAAHFGGWMMWQQVEEILCGKDIYFDTSFSYTRMPPDYAKSLIEKHGSDKILLGSDLPWSHIDNEIDFIKSLDLTILQEENIFSNNAMKLLEIDK